MPDAEKLAVRPRTITGKKVERLRRQGIVPGVIAGHGDSLSVETDAHAFELGYRRWGRTTLLTLEGLDSDAVPALVHEVSRDPRNGRLLHIDFARVSLTERTHADVPLHFTGSSAAVRNEGAVLLHALDHVRVEALPQDIPHRIEVDMSGLDTLEDAVHVRDLKVDPKVRILNGPDDLVVKPIARRAEEVVEAPVAEAEAIAPVAEGEAPAEGAAAPAPTGTPAAKPAAGTAPAAKGAAQPAGKAPAGGAKS